MADRVSLMTQRMLVWAMAGAFACGPAWAESSRLAFSKAENIEIFVEHAAGAPWCSERPDLRVVFHGAPDMAALERLMPKLGALLGQQCPQASDVTWRSQDSAGKVVAAGISSKAGQWKAVVAQPQVADKSVASGNAPVAAVAPVAAATHEQADPQPKVVVAAPPRPAQGAVAAGEKVAADRIAADKAAAEQAAAEKVAAERVAAEKLALEKAAADEAAKKAAAQAEPQATLGVADFDVKGWKPQNEADALAASPFIKTLQDQNGCNIRIGYRLDEADAKYVSLLSSGLSCDARGFAQGMGGLTLQRSDGAVIARESKVYFQDGYAFNTPVQAARLVGSNGRDVVWFSVGHNAATQSYFLLRATVAAWGGGLQPLRVNPDLDVLTSQESNFRQAADISHQIEAALRALQTQALPDANGVNVRFADGLDGVVAQNRDRMMYAIHATRDWDYRKRHAVGAWKYRLDRGDNYVFAREKRKAEEERQRQQQAERQEKQRQQQLAWEKRRALQDKAREAERQLAQYQELVAKDKAAPDSLLAQYFVRSASYTPLKGGQYARFYAGNPLTFQQIVRVSGHDGNDAKVDFPYDLRIAGGKDLKESWYAVSGAARADQKRLDDAGLPMTVVTPKSAGGIQACKKEGCSDLADPLTVMRLLHGVPDWTPETAQRQIDQAKAEG